MVAEQRNHLCSATRMLHVSSEQDLRNEDRLFIKQLRQYHDVLFVDEFDSFDVYKERLRKMYQLGILNLSFAPIDEQDELLRALAAKRSLVSRLREANKKNKKLMARVKAAEEECAKAKKISKIAEAQVAAFRLEHPEWTPPENLLLPKDQQEDFASLFQVGDTPTARTHAHSSHLHYLPLQALDKEVVDVKKQMEIDPTGMLALFWQEQRRMLHRTSGKVQWNPKVCVHNTIIYIDNNNSLHNTSGSSVLLLSVA